MAEVPRRLHLRVAAVLHVPDEDELLGRLAEPVAAITATYFDHTIVNESVSSTSAASWTSSAAAGSFRSESSTSSGAVSS